MRHVCVFGTGSLGANTAINLARKWSQDIKFTLIDYDIIETVNLANQPWYDVNVGQRKASVLSAYLYRVAKSTSVPIIKKVTCTSSFIREYKSIIKDVDVFVDCFDNMVSRELTQAIASEITKPVLHSGFSEVMCMIRWGTDYPIDVNQPIRAPVCDRRDLVTLITLGAGLTEVVISEYLSTGVQTSKVLEIRNTDIRIW